MSTEPTTLVEAVRHFTDPDVTLNTMVALRWPNGVCCPTCGRADVRFIKTRRMWECKEAHPKSTEKAVLHAEVRAIVEPGSALFTDTARG